MLVGVGRLVYVGRLSKVGNLYYFLIQRLGRVFILLRILIFLMFEIGR